MQIESCVSAETVGWAKLLSMVLVHLFGVLMYSSFWGWASLISGFHWIVAAPIYVGSVFVHEYLHYLGFVSFGGVSCRNVEFKFSREHLTPYVVCKTVTTVRRYKVAAALPFVLVGILPVTFGLLFQSATILIVGLFNLSACSGDVVLYILLMRLDSRRIVARSNSGIGFVVVTC